MAHVPDTLCTLRCLQKRTLSLEDAVRIHFPLSSVPLKGRPAKRVTVKQPCLPLAQAQYQHRQERHIP